MTDPLTSEPPPLPLGEASRPHDSVPRLHWKDVLLVLLLVVVIGGGIYVWWLKAPEDFSNPPATPAPAPTAMATPAGQVAMLIAATNPASAAAPGEKFYVELRGARLAPCQVTQRVPGGEPNICLYAEEGTYKVLGTPAAQQAPLGPGQP